MPHFTPATVIEIMEERDGLQKVRVARDDGGDGTRAYVLTGLTGPVNTADRVVVNVTAVELGLGTGGWHFVHWNLSRDEWNAPGPGHIMKLRYTSLQIDTGAVEEDEGYVPPETLKRTPVIGCLLLSQVAAVAAAYKHACPKGRLVLVVSDQNALPLVLSDLVHDLRRAELLDATVTAGQAFGGDYEAVNIRSALGVAKAVARADAIIVTEGFGSVGTATTYGFSTYEIATVLADAATYGAAPIIAARYSDVDERERHRGLSHHTRTVLDNAMIATLPVPEGEPVPTDWEDSGIVTVEVSVPDIAELFARHGLTVTTMGRGVDEDPRFFTYAAAAGIHAETTHQDLQS